MKQRTGVLIKLSENHRINLSGSTATDKEYFADDAA